MSAAHALAPAELAAATVANLCDMTPARLRDILTRWPDPRVALARIRAGHAGCVLGSRDPVRGAELAAQWARVDPEAVARLFARRQAGVFVAGCDPYPIDDAIPDAPHVMFYEGARPEVFNSPRVAIVGTRAATPNGIADAKELGRVLAAAGITIVSGMALGIDGAAHEGALHGHGGVVGVVATGLDITYPRRHGWLHDQVRANGLLISENGYGTRPNRARFPVRNRIIAALSDVVVVVEATARGGARITAEHALEYDRPVLAIPGSRRNPSAAGCNELLRDGAAPLLDPSDVLVALGMTPGARRAWVAPTLPGLAAAGTPPDAEERAVLNAMGGEPASADQIAERIGIDALDLSVVLDRMTRAGRISRERGYLWPR